VTPAAACVRFAFRVPGVRSVALNTTDPRRVAGNAALGMTELPGQLWRDLADAGLIDRRFA
jgi:D-threo-aldose 1-dehydrogenase